MKKPHGNTGRKKPWLAERNKARAKHGHSGNVRSPTYKTWQSMMQRAHAGTVMADKYLLRGITVCERWLSFENFLADMGVRPAGTSLDRIDNYLGYEKSNCRWASPTVQSRNTRNALYVTAFGQTKHIAEWAEEVGLRAGTIKRRLDAGRTPEDAISSPSKHSRKFEGERSSASAQKE